MDIVSVGTAIGSAVAGFAASWAALARPLNKKLDETRDLASAPSAETLALRDRITKIEAAIEVIADLRARAKVLEDSQRHLVSDAEFQAHTQATAKSINSLTEKVGRATGAIELWIRNQ